MNTAAKILVAEDDFLNQTLIRADLTSKGYEITIVGNGKLAVEACLSNDYDLVLMDIAMPELDGIGAAKHIRDNAKNKEAARNASTPIVALSTFSEQDFGEKTRNAGMNGYIRKPYMREELFSYISRLVG